MHAIIDFFRGYELEKRQRYMLPDHRQERDGDGTDYGFTPRLVNAVSRSTSGALGVSPLQGPSFSVDNSYSSPLLTKGGGGKAACMLGSSLEDSKVTSAATLGEAVTDTSSSASPITVAVPPTLSVESAKPAATPVTKQQAASRSTATNNASRDDTSKETAATSAAALANPTQGSSAPAPDDRSQPHVQGKRWSGAAGHMHDASLSNISSGTSPSQAALVGSQVLLGQSGRGNSGGRLSGAVTPLTQQTLHTTAPAAELVSPWFQQPQQPQPQHGADAYGYHLYHKTAGTGAGPGASSGASAAPAAAEEKTRPFGVQHVRSFKKTGPTQQRNGDPKANEGSHGGRTSGGGGGRLGDHIYGEWMYQLDNLAEKYGQV